MIKINGLSTPMGGDNYKQFCWDTEVDLFFFMLAAYN